MASRQSTKWVSALASTFALLLASMSAHAFESMKMGTWDVAISGNVNAFFTNLDCDTNGNGMVSSGLACGSLVGADYKAGNVQTGLLPSWFGLNAKQESNGWMTEINIGFQPGVDGGGGAIETGLSLGSENLRQVNIKFGTADMGMITLGRDLGIYGSDAILSDMTLLGVGTVSDLAVFGGNTTLGRIGIGYLYADWKAQVQYASPNWDGFSFNLAIVDPWAPFDLSGLSLDQVSFSQEADTFGFEGKAAYTWGSDSSTTTGKVWAGFISQSLESSNPAFASQDATGFDVGGKVTMSGLELVGYFYSGDGIGTLGFLWDGLDTSGATRDSDGFYVQGTYKFPETGTKVGVSFGESNLDLGPGDPLAALTTLVETNESFVFGVYHPLTESLNVVFEYTKTEATAHNGNSAEESNISIGAILFY